MTFFQFVKIIRQRFISIISIAIIVAIASVLIIKALPQKFDASVSLNIARVNREETPDYQYDGFYAIQASNLFADTVISWLETPATVREIYQQSGVDTNAMSLSAFSSRFSAKKMSSQNVVVRFSSKNEQEMKKMSASLVSIISKKAQDSLQTAKNQPVFELKAADPLIVRREYDAALVALAGFLTGLVLGVLWALGKNYFDEIEAKNIQG